MGMPQTKWIQAVSFTCGSPGLTSLCRVVRPAAAGFPSIPRKSVIGASRSAALSATSTCRPGAAGRTDGYLNRMRYFGTMAPWLKTTSSSRLFGTTREWVPGGRGPLLVETSAFPAATPTTNMDFLPLL